MRRLLLTIAMLLMGMALVGGAAAALVPTSLVPLDQEVGTHTSAAGAVLGIGLMAAAFNPSANVAWVRAGILYGLVVLAFEGGSYLLWREPFHIGPVPAADRAVSAAEGPGTARDACREQDRRGGANG